MMLLAPPTLEHETFATHQEYLTAAQEVAKTKGYTIVIHRSSNLDRETGVYRRYDL